MYDYHGGDTISNNYEQVLTENDVKHIYWRAHCACVTDSNDSLLPFQYSLQNCKVQITSGCLRLWRHHLGYLKIGWHHTSASKRYQIIYVLFIRKIYEKNVHL